MSETTPIDWMNETAKRLHPHLPAGWRWYQFECGSKREGSPLPAGMVRLRGCVPSRFYTSGKRKGEPVWSEPVPGTRNTVCFMNSEVRVTQEAWETQTGQCAQCDGTGQQFAGWDRVNGRRTKRCEKCGGTGLAKR